MGVVLYEVLTGELPIQGTPIQIVLRKQTQDPPEAREIEPCTPVELNDLCMRLLDRDPKRRPTANEILRCIGEADLADTLPETRSSHNRTVEIVGRERHLRELREHFAEVVRGDTLTLLVRGRSGMGKTVLVRRFLDELQRSREAVILEGRCYEQESVPFKALDSLIDALAVYLDTLPDSLTIQLQPRDTLPIIRLFPVLGHVLRSSEESAPSIESADQQELRQRALEGLRELLTKLARQQPLVLYIDDLQWGDEDSAELLADLVRPPEAPALMLLGSYRSEEIDTSSCLRALTEAYNKGQDHPRLVEIEVGSLSHDEATQLALMLMGSEDTNAKRNAERIARESGGWPFFVWELAQHVQTELVDADGALELDEVIWSRVCRLPDDTRRLLELFAVAGRPMPAQQAYEAIERVSQGPSLLAQLRSNSFVRVVESEEDTVVEPYHDRIRESVVKHLPKNTVKEQNLMLALAVERRSGLQAI